MDRKSKMLLTVLIVMTVVSVGFTFWKTVIKENYAVINTVVEDNK